MLVSRICLQTNTLEWIKSREFTLFLWQVFKNAVYKKKESSHCENMMTKLPLNGILVEVNAKSTINKNKNLSYFARYHNSKLTRKIKYLPVIFILCSLYAKLFFGHLCTTSINTNTFVRVVQTLGSWLKAFSSYSFLIWELFFIWLKNSSVASKDVSTTFWSVFAWSPGWFHSREGHLCQQANISDTVWHLPWHVTSLFRKLTQVLVILLKNANMLSIWID